jgi:acyl-CoA thioester hydrolase
VVSHVSLSSAYRGRFSQRIECRGELLVEADVDIVCVDRDQRLREFPQLGPAAEGAGAS